MLEPPAKLMRGLTEAFVLRSLSEEPKHGYALMKELEGVFGDEPNRNRIYPLLARLEEEGLVRGEEVPGSSRGKTVYHLTEDGEARLATYERMPPSFRRAVRELWTAPPADAGVGAKGEAPAASPEASEDRPEAKAAAPGGGWVLPAAGLVPPQEAPPGGAAGGTVTDAVQPDAGAPYPCPDARVRLEKDPRTGEFRIALTGCPMGAYDYCPRCPVYHGVEGLRRLLFG